MLDKQHPAVLEEGSLAVPAGNFPLPDFGWKALSFGIGRASECSSLENIGFFEGTSNTYKIFEDFLKICRDFWSSLDIFGNFGSFWIAIFLRACLLLDPRILKVFEDF